MNTQTFYSLPPQRRRKKLGAYRRHVNRIEWLKRNAATIGLVIFDIILAVILLGGRGSAAESIDSTIPNHIKEYCEIIGEQNHIAPELLESIIITESHCDPKAENGGCVGLMQISERYHSERMQKLGFVNIYDEYTNIAVGADYLRELFEEYEDMQIVLALYHGESDALSENYIESKYVREITERSFQLEKEHGKILPKVKG